MSDWRAGRLALLSTMERWLPVSRSPKYAVSDQGRVRGPRARVLKLQKQKDGGHFAVQIANPEYATGQQKIAVHLLVMEAFGPRKPSPAAEVRHRDGDETNNVWTNLVWGSRSENSRDKKHHKGQSDKLTIDQVRELKRLLATTEESQRSLGRRFGVSQRAVWSIAHGHNHAEVEA